MFFYDWKKLYKESLGSSNECMAIFRMLVNKEVPKNKYDPIYKYYGKDFFGPSFLLHEDVLVYNSWKHRNKDLCQYIALASLRSYAQYMYTGKTTLDLRELSFDPIDIIEDTRLVYIENEEIHLLYEEVPTEKLQWH
jgi:hypothetical protein